MNARMQEGSSKRILTNEAHKGTRGMTTYEYSPTLMEELLTSLKDQQALRDYFAGQALAGWLASFDGGAPHPASVQRYGDREKAQARCDAIAVFSYRLADAMLRAREKRERRDEDQAGSTDLTACATKATTEE
jgi:hypothetical protein